MKIKCKRAGEQNEFRCQVCKGVGEVDFEKRAVRDGLPGSYAAYGISPPADCVFTQDLNEIKAIIDRGEVDIIG